MPGLFDTNLTEFFFVEMTKWYTLVSPGIHAIVLIVQVGRFTEEEQQTVSESYVQVMSFSEGL